MKANLSSLIEKAIKKEFSDQPITGKLALLRHMMIQQLERVLESHKPYTPFDVVELETEFVGEISADTHTFQLKSRLDRMDKRKGSLVIIDYKTGKIESLNIPTKKSEDNEKILDEEFLRTLYKNPSRSHLFQLFFYAFLVKNAREKHSQDKREPNPYQGESPFLSICAIQNGTFDHVKRKNTNVPLAFDETVESPFIEGLQEALLTIISDEPFTQTSDDNHCRYCPFQEICGRKSE